MSTITSNHLAVIEQIIYKKDTGFKKSYSKSKSGTRDREEIIIEERTNEQTLGLLARVFSLDSFALYCHFRSRLYIA